jgi:SH3 domain-containing YSC84-like protein 1
MDKQTGFAMNKGARFGCLALLGLVLFAPLTAHAQSDQQVTVDRALRTIDDLRHDKAFGNARQLMHQARAVLIVPRLYKGGFIVGGEGGTGVMLARGSGNTWSDPAFFALGAASFGLQAGLEQSETVLFVMTQKGLDALLRDQFKFGAQAGIAVVTLGSGVEGAIGGASPPDIVVWSSSSGVYAGISLDGSVIRAQPDDDRAYYGRPVTTRDILFGHGGVAPHAAGLRRALGTVG